MPPRSLLQRPLLPPPLLLLLPLLRLHPLLQVKESTLPPALPTLLLRLLPLRLLQLLRLLLLQASAQLQLATSVPPRALPPSPPLPPRPSLSLAQGLDLGRNPRRLPAGSCSCMKRRRRGWGWGWRRLMGRGGMGKWRTGGRRIRGWRRMAVWEKSRRRREAVRLRKMQNTRRRSGGLRREKLGQFWIRSRSPLSATKRMGRQGQWRGKLAMQLLEAPPPQLPPCPRVRGRHSRCPPSVTPALIVELAAMAITLA
ncbi:hypothetical protein T492DRAFT_506664 [Pavlovales sp. CCMP2436]|nr:hypothetical protein T492DRAFT_506664 [Pavlovales sp. CCMP2436]